MIEMSEKKKNLQNLNVCLFPSFVQKKKKNYQIEKPYNNNKNKKEVLYTIIKY